MRTEITIRLFVVGVLIGLGGAQARAQTSAPSPAPAPKKIRIATQVNRVEVNPVLVQNSKTAPQVVTILHGLNGLKVFRLLLRSNELAAIANLDQEFQIENEIHTNVIAGLALDDGRSIAVWLPEAEAEMPSLAFPYAPTAPPAPRSFPTTPAGQPVGTAIGTLPGSVGPMIPGFPGAPFVRDFLEPADLKVVTGDGKRLSAKYVGLDGLTGLSVITLASNSLPQLVEAKHEIAVGQRLRVIGPEPVAHGSGNSRAGLYVRLGETEATVASVSRTPGGDVRRVRIRSAKLTPANMGGIAINETGETLGIVDAVEGNEATLVPMALVRSAAKRVTERQASVPRPWLGIQGEPIGSVSYERILRNGWQAERARALAEMRQGILLTSVVPGSPAALAHLRPGDVILKVNNGEVKNAEDFTWVLNGTGAGNLLSFTIVRPETLVSEAMEIRLSESPDPLFGLRAPRGMLPRQMVPGSLLARGIETIALKPKAAVHFGAAGGLLVVYVEPSTAASKAGIRPGDVIEAINGQLVYSRPIPQSLLNGDEGKSVFNIVRNKQKLVITVQTK